MVSWYSISRLSSSPLCLTLWVTAVTVCDTYLNIQKLNFAHILYVFISCISYNSQHKHCYFSKWLWPVGLCNRNVLCWLWGRNRSFAHYLQFLRLFLWEGLLFLKMWQDPNEWNTFGLNKDFEHFVELVVTEIYSAAYSLVLALLFLFILWRTYHCFRRLVCVYVCRM